MCEKNFYLRHRLIANNINSISFVFRGGSNHDEFLKRTINFLKNKEKNESHRKKAKKHGKAKNDCRFKGWKKNIHWKNTI